MRETALVEIAPAGTLTPSGRFHWCTMRMLKPALRTMDTRTCRPPPKETDPHYGTAAHKQWVADVLKRDGGLCQDPQHVGPREGLRCVADHIIEKRDGGDLLDVRNGLTRCWPCHTRKTNAERAKRMAQR